MHQRILLIIHITERINAQRECQPVTDEDDCPKNAEGRLIYCPVDHQWTEWHEWGDCYANCGMSNRTRIRLCIPPKHGGTPCPHYQREQVEQCQRPVSTIGYYYISSIFYLVSQFCGYIQLSSYSQSSISNHFNVTWYSPINYI